MFYQKNIALLANKLIQYNMYSICGIKYARLKRYLRLTGYFLLVA